MGKYDVAPTLAAGLIRLARAKAGLTQTELAAAAGVSQQAISAYETGRMDPTLETLQHLIGSAGLELRIRLATPDDHDESLEALLDSLPADERARLERSRRDRAAQARQRRVEGR